MIFDFGSQNNSNAHMTAIQQKECTYCFRRKTSKMGLFFSADDVTSVCFEHIYLHEKRTKSSNRKYLSYRLIPKPQEAKQTKAEQATPKKLAINDPSGFNVDKEKEYVQIRKIYDSSTQTFQDYDPFTRHGLEEVAIMLSQSQDYYASTLSKHISSWDGTQKEIYANSHCLFQIENPPQVSLVDLKCEKCDKVDNLWLNLSDGSILCGRQYFDGTGGNNHAIEHYELTKYPLAVKLGTITSQDADVFCYEKDEMVIDLYLSTHLKHFGIKIEDLTKTEKSQLELEIELNKNGYRSNKRSKKDRDDPVKSKTYVGLTNIGNTCYMASVMQCLTRVISLRERFFTNCDDIFMHANADNVNDDLNCQFSKLMEAICSPVNYDYPQDPEGWSMIEPNHFKLAVSKNHSEFITNRQQDAWEFMMHLISMLDESNPSKLEDPLVDIRFHLIDSVDKCGKLNLKVDDGYAIDLNINENNESNIGINQLFENFVRPDTIEFTEKLENGVEEVKNIVRTTKLCYLPKMLCVCIKRFKFSQKYQPIKLKTNVKFPNDDLNSTLDLTCLLAESDTVLNALETVHADNLGGVELKPSRSDLTESQIEILNQLTMMGFNNEDLSISFILKGLGLEACISAIIQAQEDPSIQDQLSGAHNNANSADQSSPALKPLDYANITVSDENVNMLVDMGYSRIVAVDTLKLCDNSIELAADKLMNDPEGNFLNQSITSSHHDKKQNKNLQHKNEMTHELLDLTRQRSANYRLKSFIVHSGKTVHNGHYIAYVRLPAETDIQDENDVWYEFNDEKVHVCEEPPFEKAYLFFFENI